MPFLCSISGCRTISKRGVTLHALPKDATVRQQWLAFVRKANQKEITGKSSHVCSQHFREVDFINRKKVELGYAQKLILAEGAVPSILSANECSQKEEDNSAARKVLLQEVSFIFVI